VLSTRSRSADQGLEIFSRDCVCTSPGSSKAAVRAFVAYTLALLDVHLCATADALLLPPLSAEQVAATAAAHTRFCQLQLRNDKTRRVLAAAMGEPWADAYMHEVLFPFSSPVKTV